MKIENIYKLILIIWFISMIFLCGMAFASNTDCNGCGRAGDEDQLEVFED